jgi:renalase
MVSSRSVAIIGAGMAGAAAGRRLHEAGLDVLLVDKGRGVGGRMATRRAEDLRFDHGAQYVTARAPRFAATVEAWVAAGDAAPWGAAPGWFVGTPAMTAPVRALTAGVAALVGCTVARIGRAETGWTLTDAAGTAVAGGQAFDTLLVTAPTPQAAALLATAGIVIPALGGVRYAPCWALMIAHDGPPPLTEPARRIADPDAPIAWVARDGTKPGRGGGSSGFGTLVVHASPAWSRSHLERAPAEVADLLRAELARMLGRAMPEGGIRYAAAHRWRYALVEEAVGEPCLWMADERLGVAGDGCLGGRVEAAYLSGFALAERVLADA